jgi:hypothetical protein
VAAPVIALLPVVHQLPHIPQLDPIAPAIVLRRVDPAGTRQAALKIVKVGMGTRLEMGGWSSQPFLRSW